MNQKQVERMQSGKGFIAALDQSGGSTPKALKLYGVDETRYHTEEEMFDEVHAMRTRIIKSPSFNSDKILGAILFEMTMDRSIDNLYTADYLWEKKGIIPFLKVDQGLAEEKDGVQLMKDIKGLEDLLNRANERNIFGTKMRSVIKSSNPVGIKAVVDQQFAIGKQIAEAGLVPILEPEVDIHIPDKKEAEEHLKKYILEALKEWNPELKLMFKVSIPSIDGFYSDVMDVPSVIRVVALSGGYSREDANERLSRNPGLIASFSRALSEGLTFQQSDSEFDEMLAESVEGIYQASVK